MRSTALLFVLSLVIAQLAGCADDGDDYQVAVTWLINGTIPSDSTCQEQGVARARFEVFSPSGKKLQTLESNCANTIVLSDGNEYGGFLTTRAFEWDTRYDFALTLVGADGKNVSGTAQGTFVLPYESADIYELGYLDFLQPAGTAAGLAAEWSLSRNGQLTTCEAERIDKVQIVVASALDPSFEQQFVVAEASCGAGALASAGNTLATGYYQFKYQALSMTGALVIEGAPITVNVGFDQLVTLPRQTFVIP